MLDSNLKNIVSASKNKDIIIENGKETIHARFEDCDRIGITIVLEEDKASVINNTSKREIRTFIPWIQINSIRIP